VALISKDSFALIVSEEVSSEDVYTKRYTHTEWPGESSGVTVGIGYDLGYSSAAKIAQDWGPRVSTVTLNAMKSAAGVNGPAAKDLASKLRGSITVPWEMAIAEFEEVEVPRWYALVNKAVPNLSKVSLDMAGVLVSLAYNRGAGGFNSTSARFSEMSSIRDAMAQEKWDAVPKLLRSMKRLWPNTVGLRNRREHEAQLWEKGMKLMQQKAPTPTPVAPNPEPAPQAPRPAEPAPVEQDTSVWHKLRNWLGGIGGLSGLTWFDYRIAIILAAVGVGGVVFLLWLFGKDRIRDWISKHFG
jgi:GH24 family phage-related lysozyme (muramidase)